MDQTTHTQLTCEDLDLGRDPKLALRVWGPPILVIVIGIVIADATGWPIEVAGFIWSAGILWLGVSCLRNALRCGRFHCSILGVGYPLLSILALSITLGWLSLPWNTFWNLIFWPLTVVAFIPEFFGLKYVGPKAR